MKAILTDVTRCIGCHKCVNACVKENNLGPQTHDRWTEGDGLSAQRFTAIVREGQFFVRKQCRHCIEPACVASCPVGALQKTAEGPVIYDKSRCLGCRYCMMACPFGIPRYEWKSPVPYVRKCTMCYESRTRHGKQPACTEACPTQATIFGEREALLDEAKKRIAAGQQKYMQKIDGEHEVGGTCVIYLSPVPLDVLLVGRQLDNRPLPDRTMLAMSMVPPAFVGMGALMGGLYWIIGRRNRLAKDQKQESHEAHQAPPPATEKEPSSVK